MVRSFSCAASTDTNSGIHYDQIITKVGKTDGVTQLIIDEEPFLVLGGELRNSSSSSSAYMKSIWPRLKALDGKSVQGGVLVMALDQSEFLVVGQNLNVSFHNSGVDEGPFEFLRCVEGTFDCVELISGRLLNGDETRHGLLVRLETSLTIIRVTVNPVTNMGKHIEFKVQG